jgi:O-antigen/teichoic acid export membrane protein
MNLILKNASYLFVSNVIVRLFSALASILIARYLGATDYGILSIGLAISAIAGYFTDMGLSHTFIREATRDDKVDLASLVGGHFKLRIIFAFIVSGFLYIIVELLYKDLYIKKIIYLMVYPTIIGTSLQGVGAVYFQAIQQMHYTAYIRSLSGIVTAATLVFGLIFKWPLILLAPVYGFSSVIGGVFSIFLLSRKVYLFHGWNANLLQGLFSYTFNGLLFMMLPQIPPIILEKVTSIEEVGYFSAAYRIPSTLYQIPGVIAAAFYPVLFRYGSNKQEKKHEQISILQLKIMSILGICMFIPFFLYSDWWTILIFGDSWGSVDTLLAILSSIVLLQSLSYPLADALTTKGYQNKRVLVMLVGFIIAVFLYYFLGSQFGAVGGAVTAVAVELMILIGFTIFLKRGHILLKRAITVNMLLLVFILVIGNLISVYIYPFTGTLIFIFLFILLTLFFDTEIRLTITKYFKNHYKNN